MARYSGYEDLKHDLARMFSIEGQLEVSGRIGWKLVYKDHEDDILLVGDDPWEYVSFSFLRSFPCPMPIFPSFLFVSYITMVVSK